MFSKMRMVALTREQRVSFESWGSWLSSHIIKYLVLLSTIYGHTAKKGQATPISLFQDPITDSYTEYVNRAIFTPYST